MLRITMLSGIIKGKATSCCFVGSPKLVVKNLCNVARGWVGCYAITIKMRREPAGTSLYDAREVEARPRLCHGWCLVDDDDRRQICESYAVDLASATGWFCDEGPGQ